HVGWLSTGGTGTVISSRFVLTAAHNLVTNGGMAKDSIAFSPGLTLKKCAYPAQWSTRIWIPNEFSFSNSEIVRCYDWALMEFNSDWAVPPMKFGAFD